MTATGPYASIPFVYDAKSPAITTTELEKGDLLISGWAMRYDEIDYEGDRWDGLSEKLYRSLQRFVDRKGPLAYGHLHDTVGIGRVLEAERVPGVGVRVKAVVAHQEPGTKWRHIYEAARRGYLPRFSLAGIFHRRSSAEGPVLEDAEFSELSICGSSIGRNTTWELIAQKALTAPDGKTINAQGQVVETSTDDWKAITDVLTKFKQEAEMWGRKTEPEARATLLTTDRPLDVRNRPLSKTELAQARARDAERAADESKLIDGVVTTEHNVNAQDTAAIFGKIAAPEVGTVERELQPHEVDGLFNVNRTEAVDPRTQGLSFLQMKELEAREAQRRSAEQAKQDEWKQRLDALEEKAA